MKSNGKTPESEMKNVIQYYKYNERKWAILVQNKIYVVSFKMRLFLIIIRDDLYKIYSGLQVFF